MQLESGLKSLSKLFTERLLRIPDYQRGFSWQPKQLKEFWSDVEQLESGHHHYLGVLTLEMVRENVWRRWPDDIWLIQSKSFVPYHVVDGQQRLTTIIILMQCIFECLKADQKLNYSSKDEIQAKYIYIHKESMDGSFLFGYEKDNPSYECLKTKILQKTSSRYAPGESTIYTKNLISAKEFFSEKLANYNIDQLQILFTKLTQHLLFNVFNIEKEVDVHVAFETMNNRGLRLSNLELLKNRLIYLTTRLGEPATNIESLRRTINDSWKTVYYYLGKNSGASLSDDYFLQIHYILYFAQEILDSHPKAFENSLYQAQDQYNVFLLEDRFTLKRLLSQNASDRLTSATLYQYSMDLKRVVEHYYSTYFPAESGYSADEKLWLERLRRLMTASHSREIFVLLLLMLPQLPKASDRVQMLSQIERYFFIATTLPYKYRKKSGTLKIGKELLMLAAKKESLTNVLDKIEKQTTAFMGDPAFSDAILEGMADSGYYDWNDLKYFMYEYEISLKIKTKRKSDKIDWETFISDDDEDHSSIEHVLPQTPSDPYWKSRIAGFTASQVKKITNSLGNFVALSGGRNSSLRNISFSEKKGDAAKKTGYRYGSYSEIEIANSTDWGPQEILKRGMELLDFMSVRWGITFKSDEHKAKCLGLDFLMPKK